MNKLANYDDDSIIGDIADRVVKSGINRVVNSAKDTVKNILNLNNSKNKNDDTKTDDENDEEDDDTEKYELLSDSFKNMVDNYVGWASTTSKRPHTIHTEKRAAICFFTHFQSRGKLSISEVNRWDVLSFFYDGERLIRGRAYASKIMPILKHSAANGNSDTIKVIKYIPKIP